MKVKKAIITAAGLGTHFLPATRSIPKEMLPVVDKPVIQYIVEEIVESGIEEILIITGRNKNMIEDHFDHAVEIETTLRDRDDDELLESTLSLSNLADIHFIRQKKPLGSGHALLMAKAFVGNEPFAVLFGDELVDSKQEPCIKQLINKYESLEHTIVAVREKPWSEVCDYGVIDGPLNDEDNYEIRKIVEKPVPEEAPSNQTVVGRFILRPEIFDYIDALYEQNCKDVSLSDAISLLAQDQMVYGSIFEGKRYDISSKTGYVKATLDYALSRDEMKSSIIERMSSVVREYEVSGSVCD